MTALLIDPETVRELLDRLDGLTGDDRREVIFTAAIESGGIFHGPVAGNAVLHLHRIPVTAETEEAAITAWLAKARSLTDHQTKRNCTKKPRCATKGGRP